MIDKNHDTKNTIAGAVIKQIDEKARNLRYGTILIKVHDSKIIQVEITEKTRFDNAGNSEEGGGI